MATKTLNTKIIIRNDTAEVWTTKNSILSKGEFGVENDTNKFKIGDGSTAWNDLAYAGADQAAIENIIAQNRDSLYKYTRTDASQSDADAISAALGGNTAVQGDIVVITTTVDGSTYEQSAFMYDGTQWAAMTGKVDADKVILQNDITMAGNYTQVGNLTKEQTKTATFATKGKSVAEALTEIFSKRLQPTITSNPAVTLTFGQAKAYEVGTTVSPTYSASLSAGSYTYGPATGITATSWEISDTAGNTADTASGSFADVVVTDNTNYKITAKANYGSGAVAVDNLGATSSPEIKIAAGSATKTSGAITGYRNTFYGTVTEKAEVTSTIIRSLSGKSNEALANGNSFTINIPVGAVRVIFAYPATLQDVSSVKDVNGLNAEIKSAFTKSSVTVAGAGADTGIAYKVYVTDFAEPVAKANSYTVKI
nr:MAG TPA: hyaluronidase [Caudoviricetes sp.]